MQTRVGSAIWRCEHRYPIVMSTREGGKLARCPGCEATGSLRAGGPEAMRAPR
jgi:hypothetical protein